MGSRMSASQEKMEQYGQLSPSSTDRGGIAPYPLFQYNISIGSDKTLQWDPPVGSEELAFALSYHFPMIATLEAKMQAAMQRWVCDKRPCQSTDVSSKLEQEATTDWGIASGLIKSPPKLGRPPKLRHPKGSVSRSVSSTRPFSSQNERARGIASSSGSITGQPPRNNLGKCSSERPDRNLSAFCPAELPGLISWKLDTGEIARLAGKKRAYAEDERIQIARNRGNVCPDHRRRKQRCTPASCPQNKQRLNQMAASQVAPPEAQRVKNQPASCPIQDAQWVDVPDSDISQTSSTLLDSVCPNTRFLNPYSASQTGPLLKAPLHQIPEIEAMGNLGQLFFDDPATVSQSSISSSPPLSIFTATNRSSLDALELISVSDSSAISVKLMEKDRYFDISDKNSSNRQGLSEDDIALCPTDITVHHAHHPSNNADHSMEMENAPTNSKHPDDDGQITADIDFDNFLHSDGYLYLDQNSTDACNLGVVSDNSELRTSACPTRTSLTALTEPPTLGQPFKLPAGAEVCRLQKPDYVDQMQISGLEKALPTGTVEYQRERNCVGAGGNNNVVRDYYAPSKTRLTRQLSSRSRHSDKEFAHSVMRQNSTHSTSSQESEYPSLHRMSSIYRRETRAEGISRHDSTNSATSQESAQNIPDGGYRHGWFSERARKPGWSQSEKARGSSLYDATSSLSARGSVSDHVRTASGLGQRPHAFRYGYKRNLLPVHRDSPYRSDDAGQDGPIDQLASVLDFTHI